jgi:hypothetical protein
VKIREGHVSNSSSSSFVIIMKRKDYDKVLEKLDGLAKRLASALAWENTEDKDLVMVMNFSDMDGTDTIELLRERLKISWRGQKGKPEDEGEDAYESFYEAWSEVREALRKTRHLYLKDEDN